MPFRIVLHNKGAEENYARVKNSQSVSPAIMKLILEKEDWEDGDTISVFKITDVDAQNEDFWDNLYKEMRENRGNIS